MTVEATPEATEGRALAAIVRGMAVALAGSVLGGGLGFVFTIVTARLLSQQGFGLLVLAVSIINLGAAFGTGGADYATIRHVAAAADPGAKRGAVATPLVLAAAVNGAVAVLVAALAEPIAHHVLGQPQFTTPLRALALVLPLTVTAKMLAAGISGLEQARGEALRKIAEQGGRIALATLAIVLGFGVTGAVLGMAAAAALAVAAVGLLLLRQLPRGGRTVWLPVREVFAFAWPQALANLAAQLWLVAAVVALGRFAGVREVALWGAAVGIARLPALVYNAFTYRFSPTIARLWEAGDPVELESLLKGVARWTAIMAAPLYAVAITLAEPLLHVYGSDYGDGARALAVIALAMLVDSLAGPNDRALIMTGRVRLEMAANVSCALLMTGGAIALTWAYGLTGAALALLAYNVLMNAVKALLVRRTLHMNALSLAVLGPLAAAAAASLVTLALARTTPLGDSLGGAIALALLQVGLYALVLLRGIGVSRVDRAALRLAIRPGS